MRLHLTTEEKLLLENLKIKNDNLQLTSQMLKAEYDTTLAKFCSRNAKKITDIENVNLGQGLVDFKDIPAKKIKSKI